MKSESINQRVTLGANIGVILSEYRFNFLERLSLPIFTNFV